MKKKYFLRHVVELSEASDENESCLPQNETGTLLWYFPPEGLFFAFMYEIPILIRYADKDLLLAFAKLEQEKSYLHGQVDVFIEDLMQAISIKKRAMEIKNNSEK